MCDCCEGRVHINPDIVAKAPKDLRIGGHIEKGKDFCKTLERVPFKTVQVFASSPFAYKCQNISNAEKEKLSKIGKTFYYHCPYVANVGAEDDSKSTAALKCVQDHLYLVENLPAAAVLHTGSIGSIQTIGNRLNDLTYTKPLNPVNCPLLLENASGEGRERGRDFEEFRKLFEILDHSKVGICLDTQHIFGACVCDFSNHESVVKMCEEAAAVCSTGVSLIHLNDSKCECGSKRDRHECIGKGHIWSNNKESLITLLEIGKECDLDFILETSDCISDIEIIKTLKFS